MPGNEGGFVEMAGNKKEEKFISLYRAYADEIYRYVFLRAGLDKALAEDITQDIFLDVFKGMGEFHAFSSERTWIFKIAGNKLCDFYRKRYAQKAELVGLDGELTESLSDPNQDTERMMESALESETVCECLAKIPQQHRIVLMLKYVEGRSVKEIARIMKKSPKAVESALTRARGAFLREYRIVCGKEG